MHKQHSYNILAGIEGGMESGEAQDLHQNSACGEL